MAVAQKLVPRASVYYMQEYVFECPVKCLLFEISRSISDTDIMCVNVVVKAFVWPRKLLGGCNISESTPLRSCLIVM